MCWVISVKCRHVTSNVTTTTHRATIAATSVSKKSYEEHLRGTKGVEILIRDAYGRIQGKFEDGAHDVAPVSGRDLTLSLDIKLQKYGEELMANKIGAIVAIEPSTGEILAMVSSPTYDPKILVGRERGKNYGILKDDFYKPLFDRALMGAYPPAPHSSRRKVLYCDKRI